MSGMFPIIIGNKMHTHVVILLRHKESAAERINISVWQSMLASSVLLTVRILIPPLQYLQSGMDRENYNVLIHFDGLASFISQFHGTIRKCKL